MATKKEISLFFDSLGIETSLETISDRIKLQKLVYLAEVFGLNTGFTFTWYIHGPYSPGLTKVMFDSENGKTSGLASDKEFTKIEKMKKFLGDDINDSDKLELIASLHYILAVANKTGASEEEVIELFMDEKPQFSEKQARIYLTKIKKILKDRTL